MEIKVENKYALKKDCLFGKAGDLFTLKSKNNNKYYLENENGDTSITCNYNVFVSKFTNAHINKINHDDTDVPCDISVGMYVRTKNDNVLDEMYLSSGNIGKIRKIDVDNHKISIEIDSDIDVICNFGEFEKEFDVIGSNPKHTPIDNSDNSDNFNICENEDCDCSYEEDIACKLINDYKTEIEHNTFFNKILVASAKLPNGYCITKMSQVECEEDFNEDEMLRKCVDMIKNEIIEHEKYQHMWYSYEMDKTTNLL